MALKTLRLSGVAPRSRRTVVEVGRERGEAVSGDSVCYISDVRDKPVPLVQDHDSGWPVTSQVATDAGEVHRFTHLALLPQGRVSCASSPNGSERLVRAEGARWRPGDATDRPNHTRPVSAWGTARRFGYGRGRRWITRIRALTGDGGRKAERGTPDPRLTTKVRAHRRHPGASSPDQRSAAWCCSTRWALCSLLPGWRSRRSSAVVAEKGGLATMWYGRRGRRRSRASAWTTTTRAPKRSRRARTRSPCASTARTRAPVATSGPVRRRDRHRRR